MKPTTRMSRLWLLAAAFLAGLPGALAQTPMRGDRIFLKNREQPIVAEVISDTINGVKTAQNVSFAAADVARIEYADAPFAYREADRHREQARYDEAILRYEGSLKAPEGTVRQFWFQPSVQYYVALCNLESGELDKAAAGFKELLAKFPDTRFLPDALLDLGRVELDKGNYAAAIQRFDEVASKVKGDEWRLRAKLWKAKAYLEQKDYDRARAEADGIISDAASEKFPEITTQAKTAKATSFVRQKRYDEAIALLTKLVDDLEAAVAKERQAGGNETGMQRTEAECKNALGQCLLKKGDIKGARLAFLWTVVLYPDFQQERAEALHYAAICSEKLGDATRAAELKAELTEDYPNAKFED